MESLSSTFSGVLLLAFLGGVLLNLMPCVFPVLSIKALSLVNMPAQERKRAVVHGLLYMLGVVGSFLFIAALLIILLHSGKQIGWGFQFQNPSVVLFLSFLLFVIALNLSGFFDVEVRLGLFGKALSEKQGYIKDVCTGILATLVATPCMAPFTGVALGYAVTQPPLVAISVFFMMGFGLALPYVLLASVPSFGRLLPKPGAWMETFRQFLAFPMYASTIWLIWVLSKQVGEDGVLIALAGMLSITFAVWLLKKQPARGIGRFLHLLFALLFLLCAAFPLVFFHFEQRKTDCELSLMPETFESGQWYDYTPFVLKQALKTGRPVFVDMTADWCITCKFNEKRVIEAQKTKDLFTRHAVILIKGDWTNDNPEITAYLESFKRVGVPLYVYYAPLVSGQGKRAEPQLLPEILGADVIGALFDE